MAFPPYLAALVLLLLTPIPIRSVEESTQKCFQGLGCFHTSAGLTALPLDPDVLGTEFHMYSRAGGANPVVINATMDESTWRTLVRAAHFNTHHDTKIITHGYMDSGKTEWIVHMKNELLKKGDFNVIAVSWPNGAKQILNKAVATAFLVSAQVEKFIRYLNVRHNTLDLAKIHLIGHSIGAQISGNVGSRLHGEIGRITGLDPAEPFYKDYSTSMRLDKTDARFVDIIHSDAEPFNGIQGYGLFTAAGHADFYPNGGVDQPGCSDDLLAGIFGILGGHHGDSSISCSHSRSHQFFIESINTDTTCKFRAHPCGSWDDYKAGHCNSCPNGGCPIMGYEASTSARGTFFLTTTMSAPFCGYEYYVEFDLTDNIADEDSYGRFYLNLLGQHNSSEAEFSRDNVHYHARTTETHLLAVSQRVGTLTGVTVRFHHKSSLGAHGKDVYLHKIVVRDTTTHESTVFCTGDARMISDQPQTFTSHTGC